jgi:hypothetical protein
LESVTVEVRDFSRPYDSPRNSQLSFKWPVADDEFDNRVVKERQFAYCEVCVRIGFALRITNRGVKLKQRNWIF